MADKPILFSGSMIRAILREIAAPGTGKTQTRRVLKLPTKGIYEHPKMGGWAACTVGGKGCYLDPAMTIPTPERVCIWHQTTGTTILPPYDLGDRLWVREAFSYDRLDVDRDGILPPWYWADGNPDAGDWTRPKPSIHMPRWASRLTLIVTDVRVQRLQDISEDDARAEGIEHDQDRSRGNVIAWRDYLDRGGKCGTAIASFRSLWDSLNAERAPWAGNPWVVAVTFRPVLGNIGGKA